MAKSFYIASHCEMPIGSGMSALACILHDLGNDVMGSDVEKHFYTEESLISKNISILSFSKENIKRLTNNYIVIIGDAYNKENEEVKEVIGKRVYYYYHDFIEKYFRNKIGVSGTHGKTTTVSLCVKLLESINMSYLIGNSCGKGSKDYEYFIFEACEYKNHFLKYTYEYLIITNIDYEHLDFYHSIEETIESFQKASNNAKVIIVNGDDNNIKKISHNNIIRYGFNYDNDYVVSNITQYKDGFKIKIVYKEGEEELKIPLVGIHNIYNFLAAYVLYKVLKVKDNVENLMYTYEYPVRRLNVRKYKSSLIIDDYAHHPTEIKALISCVKQMYDDEIIIIFEPHTYSRTLGLKKEFSECFKGIYKLYLCNTFTSSREVYNEELEDEVKKVFPNATMYSENVLEELKKEKHKVIIFLGAGQVYEDIRKMLKDQ